MKRTALCLIAYLILGCAGVTIPFTDHRIARIMFQSGHDTLNSDCIEMSQLRTVAGYLERRHLDFLSSKNEQNALDVYEFKKALGAACEPVTISLTTNQLQTELFGTATNIPNPEKLRELGGLLFEYEDVTTDSGLRLSFHLEQEYQGPKRRLVAIYRLVDGKVIHYQYAGKDNVDQRKISWPVIEFFGFALKEGAEGVGAPF